jgi:hypothetical protein
MRTKYVPAGTAVTTSTIATLPVSKLARFVKPGAAPASIRYEAGGSADAGADHVNVT